MCLRIKERKQQTATHPITVYKIVIQFDNDFYTPYTYTPILPETLQGLVPFEAKGKAHVIKDAFSFKVSKGTIHAHANASEAFYIADFLNRKSIGHHIVYECEIPKGVKYYKGKGESDYNEYASKQIRFVKRLQSPYEPKPKQTELDLR
jgi:hypothetical protein